MSVLSPRLPVTVYLSRQDSSLSVPPVRQKPGPALSKRRSVSTMKGLMPLALPTTCSSPSTSPIEPTMEGMLVDFLPEMLARDLELSSAVFEAKNMTAGTPSMSLVFDEKSKPPANTTSSSYQGSLARVQTLGAIEERDSVVSFLEYQNFEQQQYTDSTGSDLESVFGTESCTGNEPPCIRLREQSIITAATSLTSTSGTPPSPKDLMSPDRAQDYSWFEIDSDDDDCDVDDEAPNEDQPVALSPRPRTPPGLDSPLNRSNSMREFSKPPRMARSNQHYKSQSVSGGLTTLPRRQHSIRSIDVPLRGASLSRTPKPAESKCDLHLGSYEPRTSVEQRRRSLQFPHKTLAFKSETGLEKAGSMGRRSLDMDDESSLSLELASLLDIDLPSWPKPNTVYLQKSRPPSPLPSVQTWLDQFNPPCPSPMTDDLAKAVPLPPDIVETLRVSIACFPETMLLSSSLTIETIRAYSRKVRQLSPDVWRDSLVDSLPQNHRRSIWRKVVSHGRESLSSTLHKIHLHHEASDLERPHTASRSLWTPLNHVFGNCSEYICDALYAHIVAYNYISRVPRNQPRDSSHSQRPSLTCKQSQKEDIPKKAATLLGLGASPQQSPPSTGLLAKKLSTPLAAWGFGKDHASHSSPSAAQQDNATRNIEAGLMRCITRLVATAKAMVEEGTGEERMVEIEAKDVDMIFVRSLCEIVRIAEEAA